MEKRKSRGLFDKPIDTPDLLAKARESPPFPAVKPTKPYRRRLLLADHDPRRRARLARALRSVGYDIETCRSAVVLGSRLSDVGLFANLDPYDAIVCSDTLPGGSLWSVLRELDRRRELPPVLLIGSEQPFEETLHCRASRCDPTLIDILRELETLTT